MQFLGFKYQHPNDPYLVSLVELLRIIGRFSEAINPILENRTAMRQVTLPYIYPLLSLLMKGPGC